MQRYKYPLAILASAFVLVLTEQVAAAFQLNVNPGPNNLRLEQRDVVDARTGLHLGIITAQMSEPYVIERGGSDSFLNVLENSFQNWTFEQAEEDLEGSFEITLYDTEITPKSNGIEVGGQTLLYYQPGTNDPRPGRNSLHWIQRVVSNHSFATNQHGDDEDVIDIYPGQKNPFYDLIPGYPHLGGTFFEDRSVRPDIQNDHLWLAELYLAEVKDLNKSTVVTIHNGITWGWRNIFTPVQASAPTDPPPACDNSSSTSGGGSGGGSGGSGCSDNGWGDERDNRELPLFEEDEFDENDFYVVTDDTQEPEFEIVSNLLCQSQDDAVLPSETDEDWKVFNDAPSTCWFDPETNYGFEFQALENTLFTELLDFPVGIDADERFTVQVGEKILGEFSPGESVDFVSLVGSGIAEFKILDIDTQQDLADVPFKVGFNGALASFQMRAIAEPEQIPTSIPEPGSVAGILTIGLLGIGGKLTKRK